MHNNTQSSFHSFPSVSDHSLNLGFHPETWNKKRIAARRGLVILEEEEVVIISDEDSNNNREEETGSPPQDEIEPDIEDLEKELNSALQDLRTRSGNKEKGTRKKSDKESSVNDGLEGEQAEEVDREEPIEEDYEENRDENEEREVEECGDGGDGDAEADGEDEEESENEGEDPYKLEDNLLSIAIVLKKERESQTGTRVKQEGSGRQISNHQKREEGKEEEKKDAGSEEQKVEEAEEEGQEVEQEEEEVAKNSMQPYSVYEDWRILESLRHYYQQGGEDMTYSISYFWPQLRDPRTKKRLLWGLRTVQGVYRRYNNLLKWMKREDREAVYEYTRRHSQDELEVHYCIFKGLGGKKKFIGITKKACYNWSQLRRATAEACKEYMRKKITKEKRREKEKLNEEIRGNKNIRSRLRKRWHRRDQEDDEEDEEDEDEVEERTIRKKRILSSDDVSDSEGRGRYNMRKRVCEVRRVRRGKSEEDEGGRVRCRVLMKTKGHIIRREDSEESGKRRNGRKVRRRDLEEEEFDEGFDASMESNMEESEGEEDQEQRRKIEGRKKKRWGMKGVDLHEMVNVVIVIPITNDDEEAIN